MRWQISCCRKYLNRRAEKKLARHHLAPELRLWANYKFRRAFSSTYGCPRGDSGCASANAMTLIITVPPSSCMSTQPSSRSRSDCVPPPRPVRRVLADGAIHRRRCLPLLAEGAQGPYQRSDLASPLYVIRGVFISLTTTWAWRFHPICLP